MAIYDDIGGQAAVKTAVSVFYSRVLSDDTLSQWFDGIDLSRLRAHQRAFLAAALDGPQLFAGRDIGEAHAGMAITDMAFTSIVEHLCETLRDLGVDDDVISTVEERVEALRSSIVEA